MNARRPVLFHSGTPKAAAVIAAFLQHFPAGEVVDLSTPEGELRFQQMADGAWATGPVTLEAPLPIIYKG